MANDIFKKIADDLDFDFFKLDNNPQFLEFTNMFKELIARDCSDAVLTGMLYYEYWLLDEHSIIGSIKIIDDHLNTVTKTLNFPSDCISKLQYLVEFYEFIFGKVDAQRKRKEIISWDEIAKRWEMTLKSEVESLAESFIELNVSNDALTEAELANSVIEAVAPIQGFSGSVFGIFNTSVTSFFGLISDYVPGSQVAHRG